MSENTKNSIYASVVIATYNRCNQIGTLLDCLFNQDLASDTYEIIVVDDGSADNTQAVLHQFKQKAWQEKNLFVNVIKQENGGQAAARHNGVENSQGKMIVFLDDDMEPTNHTFLSSFVQMHRSINHECVIIGKILPPKDDRPRAGFEYWWEKRSEFKGATFADFDIDGFASGLAERTTMMEERNILREMFPGLPPEPEVDDVAFF